MIATLISWMLLHICQEFCSSEHFILKQNYLYHMCFLILTTIQSRRLKYGLNQEPLKQLSMALIFTFKSAFIVTLERDSTYEVKS